MGSFTFTNCSRRGWHDLTPFLYRALISALYPAFYPRLAYKYAEGLDERRALYPEEKRRKLPENPLWIHAVSVGEVQSAWPLLEKIDEDGRAGKPLLSTTTATGRDMAFRLAGNLVSGHIFYPWDVPRIVRRALDAIRPKGYIVIETEIWPSMLFELKRRHIPAFLVNGRFSERTAANIRKRPSFWREVYDSFSLLLVRSGTDRSLLLEAGLDEGKIRVTGDCKIDALLLRKKKTDISWAKKIAGGAGPVFLAGSTHQGEETIALDAYRIVRSKLPSARLILAPRHPERSGEAAALARGYAPTVLLSEAESGRAADWSVLVVDRIGVLFDLYGVADSAFIGGSIVDKGGQNIMEPAAFGIPFSHGPYMRDFVDAAEGLGKRGAAVLVRDAGEIGAHWMRSLKEEEKQKARTGAGEYFAALGGAAAISLDAIYGEMNLR